MERVHFAWRFVGQQLKGHFSDAEARILCYLLAPVTGALFLRFRPNPWSVRFHAIYSILTGAAWALVWGILRLGEALSPWFLGTLLRELRLTFDIAFVLVWVVLALSAAGGIRVAVLPPLHALAVKLARRYDRHIGRTVAVA